MTPFLLNCTPCVYVSERKRWDDDDDDGDVRVMIDRSLRPLLATKLFFSLHYALLILMNIYICGSTLSSTLLSSFFFRTTAFWPSDSSLSFVSSFPPLSVPCSLVKHTKHTDPPSAPSVSIVSTTTSSLLVSWDLKTGGSENPISGFYLFHKSESSDWKEVTLPAQSSTYNLTQLSCGRRYHLYLIAFNEAGRGPPSEVISAKTDGAGKHWDSNDWSSRPRDSSCSILLFLNIDPNTAPIAPSTRELIQSNSTFVVVNLSAWRDSGCPISHFSVQYKPRTQRDFILLSNHVLPEAGNLIITDLLPAKWYTLFLTATNEAGSTEAEYSLSTLTTSGELIPAYPLESLDDFATRIKFVMPIACASLVVSLLVTVMFIFKRKRSLMHHHTIAYQGKRSVYLCISAAGSSD